MSIGLILPWDSQPQEVVGVNPDAGHAQAAFNLASTVDVVSGRPLTLTSSPTPFAGAVGRGLQFNGSSNYASLNMPEVGVYTGGATIFALVEGSSVGTDRRAFGISSAVNTANFFYIGSGATDQTKLRVLIVIQPGAGTVAESTLPVFDGLPHVACLRWQHGVGTTAFIDGVQDVFAANTGTAGITAMTRANFGSLLRTSASHYFPGKVYGGVVVPRAMSDDECRHFSSNFWNLFQPRSIWVPVSSSASGTSYTISPSGGITFSGSGTEVHTKVIDVNGGVTFAGTGSMAFATTGTTYTISPSGGITFAGTGVQVRSKTIAPEGGFTFSGSGLDLRTKVIDISGGVTFGGTGSMTSNTSVVTGTVGERTKVGVGT